MRRHRALSAAVAGVIAFALLFPAPAAADPDDPGYSVDGGGQPGLERWPRVCGTAPIACGLRRDPGSGAWIRPPTEKN
jgi:hypothetical protein